MSFRYGAKLGAHVGFSIYAAANINVDVRTGRNRAGETTEMTTPYKVTWFFLGESVTGNEPHGFADTWDEVLELIPQGPPGWHRYSVSQGKRWG